MLSVPLSKSLRPLFLSPTHSSLFSGRRTDKPYPYKVELNPVYVSKVFRSIRHVPWQIRPLRICDVGHFFCINQHTPLDSNHNDDYSRKISTWPPQSLVLCNDIISVGCGTDPQWV